MVNLRGSGLSKSERNAYQQIDNELDDWDYIYNGNDAAENARPIVREFSHLPSMLIKNYGSMVETILDGIYAPNFVKMFIEEGVQFTPEQINKALEMYKDETELITIIKF